MKFAANFDADAYLSVSARLLPFMDSDEFPDSSPVKDPDARTEELYTSLRINLIRYEFMRQAKGKLALAKGSPLEVLRPSWAFRREGRRRESDLSHAEGLRDNSAGHDDPPIRRPADQPRARSRSAMR